MTRTTLTALALVSSLTACSGEYEEHPQPDLGWDEGDLDPVEEDEDIDPETAIEEDPEVLDDEPVIEVFEARPAMSTIVYSPDGSSAPVTDVCIGEFSDIEVIDGLFEASLSCTLQTYQNVFTLDIEGELFEDGSVEGTLEMTLNGQTHVDTLESAVVDGQTRLYWEGTWEILATSYIDYIGSMDLE